MWKIFFTHSELIESVSPQAAQAWHPFIIRFLSQHPVRDARPFEDLIRETSLVKEGIDREEIKRGRKRRRKIPAPGGI